MATAASQIVDAIATGKGVRPQSGKSIIQAEWLVSKTDLDEGKKRMVPSPEKPVMKPRAHRFRSYVMVGCGM